MSRLIKVTKVRSSIGANSRQKKMLEALGLRKIGSWRQHEEVPAIMGMVNKVRHLIAVESVPESKGKES